VEASPPLLDGGAGAPTPTDRLTTIAVRDPAAGLDERAGRGGLVDIASDEVVASTMTAAGPTLWAIGSDPSVAQLVATRVALPPPTPQPPTGESPVGLVAVGSDGGVLTPPAASQGGAPGPLASLGVFCGSTGGVSLARPVVGVAEVPDRFG